MGQWALTTLRVVIAIVLAGSLFVQAVIVPLFWVDLEGAPLGFKLGLVIPVVLLIVTMQVSAVCIWQLLTMVRRGSMFSLGAFRYVDVVMAATAAASVFVFAIAVVLAIARGPAPGVVALICGASLVIAGVALLVYVLKMLLRQAVGLRAELDEVV